ncbi:MAG: GntR family transcriptional regulator [Gaiellales bacterium]
MSGVEQAARPTAQSVASAVLRTAILEGELRPGDRVNQEAWAARVGVSLIPIREALHALAGEGLVTYRPRRGYVVTELDLATLEEVYRLRRILESDALEQGVPRASTADVAELSREAERCREAAGRQDVASQLAANRRFHDRLHALAGSAPLVRLIGQLWDTTEAYRALYYLLPDAPAEADEAHRALVDAVSRHDVDEAVAIQDAHRGQALAALRAALAT